MHESLQEYEKSIILMRRYETGYNMEKSENLRDERSQIVIEEVLRFKELVKNHKKLIRAIGEL